MDPFADYYTGYWLLIGHSLVVLSVFALCIGHPGLVFRSHERSRMDGMTVQSSGESQTSRPDPIEPKSEV